MKKTYKIAGLNIAVSSLYEDVHRLCADYISDGEPDITVITNQSDIDFERKKADGRYSDGYLETLAVYRKIAETMPEHDTVLCHGSALAVDGEGCIFVAPSGTGKSTHARLWRQYLGDRVIMINDDKPLIKITKNGAFVCGTPWDGKHKLSANITVPLKALSVLSQAKENSIKQTEPSEAYAALLQQVYRPKNAIALMKTLDLIDTLTAQIRLYSMECNMDIDAARIAYEAMKG